MLNRSSDANVRNSSDSREPKRGRSSRPPRQKRSLKTYNALLDAAERLLRHRPWEEISTVAIMLEAGCSNGAIYGRFESKDELLMELYRRHDARLRERFSQSHERTPREDETLKQFLEREIDGLIDNLRENRWLLRAVGLLSRTRPEIVSSETREERRVMFENVSSRFRRFDSEINHPDAKRGVELGIFFVATVLREAVLYQGPHFGTLALSDAELRDSLVTMALRFLGVDRAAPSTSPSRRARGKK